MTSDGGLAGTPGWRERLTALADWTVGYVQRVRPDADPETWTLAPYGCTGPMPQVTVADLRAAAAPSPQEGGGGAGICAWCDNAATHVVADSPQGAVLACALDAGNMRTRGFTVTVLPPPASAQVDRETLARACKDAARDLAAGLGRDDDWWRVYADRLASLLRVRTDSDG